ncbi:ARO1-like protein [Trifolium medium]|uniref:ARO1-like protein n=1 Tax=Trifolium medium TaxID=97028 RepID=A0A392MFP7_9FABA|nr:ARO1-like protein [Trifolium medium]
MAEGGVVPLLKLMKEEGNTQGQENAARAIRLLKLIDSAIILITNSTMRTAELSARTTRMESKTFADDVSCSRSDCFLCE